MTVTAQGAASGIPTVADDMYVTMHGISTTNVINPGDYVCFSGSGIAAVEDAAAYWKASGLGIALERNPTFDMAGRTVVNSAVVVATRGLFYVSGAISGQINAGILAFPATTGSGVNAPTGLTGVGATWGTANPFAASGATGAGAGKGVAQILASFPDRGPAGTGQWYIRLWPRNADYY